MSEKSKKEIMGEAFKRNWTGVMLAIILVALWFIQGWPLRITIAFIMLMSVWEMYQAFAKRGARPVRWVGVLYGLAALPVYMIFGQTAMMALCAVMCMAGLSVLVLRGEVDLDRTVSTILPLLYPGFLISLMFPLMDLKPRVLATVIMGLCFLTAMLNDVAAYSVGRKLGKTKLSPSLSPKKTVEGAVAGGIASLLTSILIPLVIGAITSTNVFDVLPLWQFAAIGVLTGFGAPIGDLSASMIKRHCGIKDYGTMFPGHGGMMDRMDSVIFTGAIVYCWLTFVQRAV